MKLWHKIAVTGLALAAVGVMEAGKVTPVIDRIYGSHEIPAAIRYLEEGHARGKVVVSLR